MSLMGEPVERVDEQDRVLNIVDRGNAIRHGWLHRVATGQYNWLLGGAVEAGESYQEAATRELTEELGARATVRFAFKYLCQGAISPYWMAIHETVIADDITPDPSEIAWHGWLPEADFRQALRRWPFVPDSREAFTKYDALPPALSP